MAQAAMLLALVQDNRAAHEAVDALLAKATGEAEAYLRRRASQ
jgi:hypothetical protein